MQPAGDFYVGLPCPQSQEAIAVPVEMPLPRQFVLHSSVVLHQYHFSAVIVQSIFQTEMLKL